MRERMPAARSPPLSDPVNSQFLRKAPGRLSLQLKRKAAAWDDDFLTSLIAA
jgi:hypothetical protein